MIRIWSDTYLFKHTRTDFQVLRPTPLSVRCPARHPRPIHERVRGRPPALSAANTPRVMRTTHTPAACRHVRRALRGIAASKYPPLLHLVSLRPRVHGDGPNSCSDYGLPLGETSMPPDSDHPNTSSTTSDALDTLLDCTVEGLEAAKEIIVDALSVPGTGIALDAVIGILKKVQVQATCTPRDRASNAVLRVPAPSQLIEAFNLAELMHDA
ncbi:hypothetical protein OH76DRAFT_523425 [Lentinus brumalis]|uniref:Uncharacterized protein n=1 Tax=Lentinus brumalis TaxID=2498619 RepID=A0A371DAV6_9APHY|nr:hypothetical protein OH76DRAFT_523425 [Polyporus brumalis]